MFINTASTLEKVTTGHSPFARMGRIKLSVTTSGRATNSSESLSIKQLIDSEDKEETVSVSQKFCAKIDRLQQASPLLCKTFASR